MASDPRACQTILKPPDALGGRCKLVQWPMTVLIEALLSCIRTILRPNTVVGTYVRR
jgi:hypothetical protein